MSGPSTYQPQNAFLKWFEARLPIIGLVHSSFVVYPTPKNLALPPYKFLSDSKIRIGEEDTAKV